PYHELVKVMAGLDTRYDTRGRNSPAYLVFDEGFRRRYSMPGIPSGGPVPSWAVVAGDPAILPRRLALRESGLAAQVGAGNRFCAAGVDHEFGRGGDLFDRYHGDPEMPGSPNLGPLDEPPFYAVQLLPGTIGSKGGPVTDVDARVLTDRGAI